MEFNSKNNYILNKLNNIETGSEISNFLFGISNISNTCYINASMQILFHSYNFLEKFGEYFKKNKVEKESISKILYDICKYIYNIINEKSIIIDISWLVYYFKNNHITNRGITQQDSIEFLRLLLDNINKELNEIKNKLFYEEIKSINNISKKEVAEKFKNIKMSHEKWIFTDLFNILLITICKCICGKK